MLLCVVSDYVMYVILKKKGFSGVCMFFLYEVYSC